MSLGTRIREARLALNPYVTQEQLARRIGVTTATPSRWESDKNRPYDRLLAKIAEELQTTVEWLTQDDEKEAADAAMLGHVENIAAAIAAALGVAMVAKQSEITAEPERYRIPGFSEPGRPWADPRIEADA